MTLIGQAVSRLRKEKGFSQQQLGSMVGMSQQAIDRLESGRTGHPRKIVQLARVLGVSPDELERGEILPAAQVVTGPSEQSVIPLPAPAFSLGRDLPVLGRAQGGAEGNLVMEEGAIDWTFRPADLAGVRDAFAVYVTGTSMVPKYQDGDLVYVHPSRPPRRDRFVLVETSDHRGLIKQFIKWDEDMLVLRQLNPEDTIRLPRARVLRVMLIIGSMDG